MAQRINQYRGENNIKHISKHINRTWCSLVKTEADHAMWLNVKIRLDYGL